MYACVAGKAAEQFLGEPSCFQQQLPKQFPSLREVAELTGRSRRLVFNELTGETRFEVSFIKPQTFFAGPLAYAQERGDGANLQEPPKSLAI